MNKTKSVKYFLFIIVLYMFTFEFALMQYISVAKYWDEVYALLFIPLFISRYFKDKNRLVRKTDFLIFFSAIVYVCIGLLGNALFQFQGIAAVVSDVLLNLKFFLGIYTTIYLFENLDYHEYGVQIKAHVKLIIAVLTILVIIDEVIKYFPSYEERYGIRSEQLFFGHPTGLSSVGFFLTLALCLFYEKKTKDKFFLLASSFLVVSTMRFKALAVVAIFLFLFVIVEMLDKKLTWKGLSVCGIAGVAIGWQQISGYFLQKSSLLNARGALTYKAFEIGNKYFPLGTGLGTFASAPSADHYSRVYRMFGISDVYGLTSDNPILVSDVFWPMVIGQTGYLGLIVYIILTLLIVIKIFKSYTLDRNYYLAGLGAIIYLLVSSTAESAFVNPLSLPLSVIIGMIFIEVNKSNYE